MAHDLSLQSINAVWYDSSNFRIKTPSQLPLKYISHIYYTAVNPRPNGDIVFLNDDIDLHADIDGYSGALAATLGLRKQKPGLKVLLSIGHLGHQSDDAFDTLTANDLASDRFIYNIGDLVQRYELDGIDIDWNFKEKSRSRRRYERLIQDLRAFLRPSQHLLTISCGYIRERLDLAMMSRVQENVDYINAKCFDFYDPTAVTSGHHSGLYPPVHPVTQEKIPCADRVIGTLHQSSGVPLRKMIMGVPLYGRSFVGASHVLESYKRPGGKDGIFLYNELPRPNSTEDVDIQDRSGACYCVNEEDGFVSYDNPQSITLKSDYIRRHGLAGFFFNEATADTDNPRSLIYAGFIELQPDDRLPD